VILNNKGNTMNTDIGITVKLKEDFSVVRETLERIGIINKKTKTFYPSCYCVEAKQNGMYKIVHFKELFPLFNRTSDFGEVDKLRRKTITHLLKNWNLIEIVNTDDVDEILSEKIAVLKHSEKKEYTIVHKFKFSSKIII
jgi:hypothetical protein